jgi:hypothetical protein
VRLRTRPCVSAVSAWDDLGDATLDAGTLETNGQIVASMCTKDEPLILREYGRSTWEHGWRQVIASPVFLSGLFRTERQVTRRVSCAREGAAALRIQVALHLLRDFGVYR